MFLPPDTGASKNERLVSLATLDKSCATKGSMVLESMNIASDFGQFLENEYKNCQVYFINQIENTSNTLI